VRFIFADRYNLEDEGATIRRHARNHTRSDACSHHTGAESSTKTLSEI